MEDNFSGEWMQYNTSIIINKQNSCWNNEKNSSDKWYYMNDNDSDDDNYHI